MNTRLKPVSSSPSARLSPLYGLVLLALLVLFILLALGVSGPQGLFFDQPVLAWLHAQQAPWLTSVAKVVAHIFSIVGMGVACLLILAWLCVRWRRSAVFFLLSALGATVLLEVIKHVVARPRPELFPHLALESGASFPSAHAGGSIALILALYFLSRQLFPRYSWAVALFGGLWVLLVSLSRLYLQVHYPSDVLASWALCAFWVLLVNVWYARQGRLR
jgi:undecaprenyl-diphosphatase